MQSINKDKSERTKDEMLMSKNAKLTCKVIDYNTGKVCGEKSGLEILNEFRQLYEQKIQSIDPNSVNGDKEKINIMMEWIKDLDAQNTMLVYTIEELEEAACQRVLILEQKLKNTSLALTDNIPQYAKSSEKVLECLHKQIEQLETNEHDLKQKVKNLESDIRGLIELIRRANTEKIWRFDGIKFLELKREKIPVSDESIYGQVIGHSNAEKPIRVILEFDRISNMYPASVALCDCQNESNLNYPYHNNPKFLH